MSSATSTPSHAPCNILCMILVIFCPIISVPLSIFPSVSQLRPAGGQYPLHHTAARSNALCIQQGGQAGFPKWSQGAEGWCADSTSLLQNCCSPSPVHGSVWELVLGCQCPCASAHPATAAELPALQAPGLSEARTPLTICQNPPHRSMAL